MDWQVWLSYGVTIGIPLVMLFIVPRNREPGSAIAWLLIIALLPLVGLVIFWILGNPKLPRRRRRKQAEVDEILRAAVRNAREHGEVPDVGIHQDLAQLMERLGGLPPTQGNAVEVYEAYHHPLEAMVDAVNAAQRYVHVQYYILAMDATTEPVIAALERAAKRGVAVRVLFDHIGSRAYPRHAQMLRRFDEANIRWRRMLPVLPWRGAFARPDLRNHRKIVVVDGHTAFAGSQNLIDRSYLVPKNRRKGIQYQEVVFQVQGPAAASLDVVFRTDWMAETDEHLDEVIETATPGSVICQVLPSGPAHEHENNLIVFNQLAYRAKQRLTLINPYFVPDSSFVAALTTAAQRGVRVQLITCAEGDHKLLDHAQRSYYERLLRAGVHIALYPAPELLHSKTLTIDDDLAIIGSSNLDMRSFHLNMEVTTLFYGAQVNQAVRAIETSYLAKCTEIELGEWMRRPLPGQVLDSVARLTAHLQ
ncbi:MAG: cardiolipin synthase [Thermoplasmatota archaeon]